MPDPVADAADTISNRLDSGFLNPVTNGDIKDAVKAITDLPAADANRLVDQLEQNGQLDQIADEVNDGSWFGNGGLSADERNAFFADMAGKLDGQNLAAISESFSRTDDGGGEFGAVTDLAGQVATHASPQTRVDYIAAMKPGVDDSSYADTGFGHSTTHLTDAQASAVGNVLGSLRGSHAEAGFEAIGDRLPDVLSSAVDGSLNTTTMGMGSATTATWNAEGYGKIMDAAATMGDADLKARVFDAGVGTLREVRDTNTIIGGLTVVGKDDALGAMTDGLTAIVNSDTTGVMTELTFNRETSDGSSFAAYAKEMFNQGNEAALGQQMARLQLGNDENGDPIQRLNETITVPGTDQERRPNAGALGYFVGSTYAATASITTDVADQRAMATSVLDSALAIVDKAARSNPVAGAVASVAKEWTHYAINAAIDDPTADAATKLENAALPVNSQTGELGVGDDVSSAFNDTLASVQRRARP
jgi:hypothetical protein